MSVGNINSRIRNKPCMNAKIPIELLPILPKCVRGIQDCPLEANELDTLQVLHDILSSILIPLNQKSIIEGVMILCYDEKVRKCIPKLIKWLADHIENCTLLEVQHNQCPVCIATSEEFGELPQTPFPH